MDKKSVIKTLRHDFELILMNTLDNSTASVRTENSQSPAGNQRYFIFPQTKGFNYYITNPEATELIRMERASSKKTIVEAVMMNYSNGIPDSIGISHKTFEFNIGLKKIER